MTTKSTIKMIVQRHLSLLILPFVLYCSASYAENTTSKIIDEGVVRTKENQLAQKHINTHQESKIDLIDQYEELLKVVDGLNAYNGMMSRQVDRQRVEMDKLRDSIANVSVIERQILPLLSRMLDGLNDSIELDIPFLLIERKERTYKLRGLLERVDISAAEKARRVFEAYQIEAEYGRTIEAYRGKQKIESGVFDVDFLRVGRVALLYRTIGTEDVGMWDKQSRTWVPLPSSKYRRYFEQGVKVARQEMAPELITLPIVIDEEV